MNKKNRKIRLDKLLVERGLCQTRERAKSLILTGAVLVNEIIVDKAGAIVAEDAAVRLKGEDHPYVSRGGVKLKGALDVFALDVRGLVGLDVGASTGGFTDCLLQEGAQKIYAVDVGYGQFAWSLRNDDRVVLFERTNIRFFSGVAIEDKIDIVVIDTSFISLKLVIPAVLRLIGNGAIVLALLKPQFEAGYGKVGKKGVIKDPEVHKKILDDIIEFFTESDLKVNGTCESPLLGPAGNKEFFLYAVKESTNFRPATGNQKPDA
jgi:23S rRNA (cytidine1920-2'-O)/16S rRNA (cytidine1409-2'-O)-methyltransferase